MYRRLAIAAVFSCILAAPALAQREGCGSRGGPGWRTPEGRCAGWKTLRRDCGDPPSLRCSFEGGGVQGLADAITKALPGARAIGGAAAGASGLAATAAPTAAQPAEPAPAPAPKGFTGFNVRAVAGDVIGCAAAAELQALRKCPAERKEGADCAAIEAAALSEGRCQRLRKGDRISVEAGDGGFDLVRVRVPTHSRGLWIERRPC